MSPFLARALVLLCLLLSALPCRAQQPGSSADMRAPAELVLPPEALPPLPPVPSQPAHTNSRRLPMRASVANDSTRKDLTLYVDVGLNPMLGTADGAGEGGYRPLCFAPCEFQLRNGHFTFGVVLGDTHQEVDPRRLIEVKPQLDVKHGDHLVLRHRSRWAVRATGWFLLAASVAGGALIAVAGEESGGGAEYPARIAGGTLLGLGGAIGSMVLAAWPDHVAGWVER